MKPENTMATANATNHPTASLIVPLHSAPRGARRAQSMTALPGMNPPRLHMSANGSAKIKSNWLKRKVGHAPYFRNNTRLVAENTE